MDEIVEATLFTAECKRVKEAGRFRWAATRGLVEQELSFDLPEDLQKDIQRNLCLDLVEKVPLFELLEDSVLDAICQKLFIESSEILNVEMGKCVERMLFIIRGKFELCKEDGSIILLKEGVRNAGFWIPLHLEEPDCD
ncbi:unnamed protein product [Calypogeia fissa]